MESRYLYRRNRLAKKRRRKRIIRKVVTAAISILIVAAIIALAVWIISAFTKKNKPENNNEKPALAEQTETQKTETEPEKPVVEEEEAPPVEPEPEIQIKTETVTLTEDDIHKGILILVNRDHPFSFTADYEMTDLFTFKSSAYKFRDTGMMFAPFAGEKLNEMLVDFHNKTGNHIINIISAFRDIETQQRIYDSKLKYYNGDVAVTEKWVALPGSSEHHTGLAVDLGIYTDDGDSFDYDGTGEYAWINENCWKYGFIVRYDSSKTDITGIAYEPWHFRYLGLPHSEIISGTTFCYEEYTEYLKMFPQNGDHLFFTSYTGERYEIFYVPSQGAETKVELPENSDYFISGNNADGFIVTVTLHDNP